MTIKNITPYLMFDGTAREAIALYEKAFGAKPENVMTFGDVPAAQELCSSNPENAKRLMHACLSVGGHQIMLSDGPIGKAAPSESNVQVSLAFDSVDALTKTFDTLAAGGSVTVAVHDTFWGAKFGMLTDAFGIRWMLNCDVKKG